MKISEKFPKLQNTNALLVVSGRFVATIHRLRGGEIHEKETLEIKKPEYSDKEGLFGSHGKGRLQASGGGYEAKTDYMKQKFLSLLSKEIKNIKSPYDSIYLFAPEYLIKDIEASLPKPINNKIDQVFAGNFTKHKYIDLLKKIKDQRIDTKNKTKLKPTGQAAKILKKVKR